MYTALDAYLYVFWRWRPTMGIETQEMYLRYTALVGKVIKRRAVTKALDKDNVDPLVPKL